MYINNNLSNQRSWEQSLELEIQSLNQKLEKWKSIIAQLPDADSLPKHQFWLQIQSQLDQIHQILINFIKNFIKQQQNIKVQLDRHISQGKMGQINPLIHHHFDEEQKFKVVNDKIESLQLSLRKTQQSEQKLVQRLNIMMTKYQTLEHQSKIQNQDYFNTQTLESRERANPPAIGFKSCGGAEGQYNKLCFKGKVYPTVSKQEGEKIIFKEANFNYEYSTESNTSEPQNFDQLRIFAQAQRKVSLRPFNSRKEKDNDESRQSRLLREGDKRWSKHASLNKHDHRLQFMMNNLGQ